jgi:plastocyanin
MGSRGREKRCARGVGNRLLRKRFGRRFLLVGFPVGVAGVFLSVAASLADGPTIEAAGPGSSGYFWRPSTASVGPGGTVTFKNTSATVPHGVTWTGGPEKPSCSGVPIEGEKTSWSGDCTFAQAGTYAFVCTVHPTEMKGTITVSSGETPPGPPPPPGGSPESPLQGSASSALKLAKSQKGSSVRGSVALSQASAGGRLEVLLLARQASLSAAGPAGMSRVGRLVRSPLSAGRVSFAVPLKRAARMTLRSNRKLSLRVQIKVVPPGHAALTLTRGVVLHV